MPETSTLAPPPDLSGSVTASQPTPGGTIESGPAVQHTEQTYALSLVPDGRPDQAARSSRVGVPLVGALGDHEGRPYPSGSGGTADPALTPGYTGEAPSVPSPETAGTEDAAPAASTASTGGAPDLSPPAAAPAGPAPAGTLSRDAADTDTPISDDRGMSDDDNSIPWRSPFELPGRGRTVSSGASAPRPEPTQPRAPSAGEPSGNQTARDAAPSTPGGLSTISDQPSTPPAPRPAPGTEAWERERVERLARTFRETLRVLEESLSAPHTERRRPAVPPIDVSPAQAEPSPAPEPMVAVAAPASVEAPTVAPADLVETPVAPPAPAAPAASVPMETATAELPPTLSPAALAGADAAGEASELPEEAHATPITPAPPRPLTATSSDVLRNIEEAALIRQRLPQHIDMLLRIPTNEVAQNSYKSPFRETREALIGRLLDPQLTLEEAARILGVCPTTVRRYTNRGMLHCHRTPGNQRRFRMSDVLQFLEQYGDRIDRAAEAKQYEEAA
jgi:excisionase family DNA binding protein